MSSAKRGTKRKAQDNATDESSIPLEEKTRFSTITMPATQSKCVPDKLMILLRKVVKETNNVAFFGSQLANLHATRVARGDIPKVDNLVLSKDYYATCMALVSTYSTATKNKAVTKYIGLLESYKMAFEIEHALCEAKYHGNIVQYTAGELAQAAEEYEEDALFHHLSTYLRAKYKIEQKGLAKYLAAWIMKVVRVELEFLPAHLKDKITLERAQEIIDAEFALYHAKRSVLHYRLMLLETIERVNSSAQDEKNKFKVFTLTPVRSSGVKFITMDIGVIQNLWRRMRPDPKNEQAYSAWAAQLARDTWSGWIKNIPPPPLDAEPSDNTTESSGSRGAGDLTAGSSMDDVAYYHDDGGGPKDSGCQATTDEAAKSPAETKILSRGKGWVLGRIVRTNGYEFHVQFERNARRTAHGRLIKIAKKAACHNQDFDPDYVWKNVYGLRGPLALTQFAAADIGATNLVCAVSPVDGTVMRGQPLMDVRNYTRKEFNHHSKRNAVNKKAERIKERKYGVRTREAKLGRAHANTANVAGLQEAIKARLQHYDALWEAYGSRNYMTLKAAARIAEQKTIDKLVHYITWGSTKPLGWGDCSRTTGIRGTSPGGPMKKIRRHAIKKGYDITLVQEQYTSKRACCCLGSELKPVKFNGVPLHGLRTCPTCGSTWNRDVSAAINIFIIFFYTTIYGRPRPYYLSRWPRTQ